MAAFVRPNKLPAPTLSGWNSPLRCLSLMHQQTFEAGALEPSEALVDAGAYGSRNKSINLYKHTSTC